jgi:hypothetical protein
MKVVYQATFTTLLARLQNRERKRHTVKRTDYDSHKKSLYGPNGNQLIISTMTTTTLNHHLDVPTIHTIVVFNPSFLLQGSCSGCRVYDSPLEEQIFGVILLVPLFTVSFS